MQVLARSSTSCEAHTMDNTQQTLVQIHAVIQYYEVGMGLLVVPYITQHETLH